MIEFEKILYSIHPNIAFTTELQSKNPTIQESLTLLSQQNYNSSFLNVLVDNSGPNLVTSSFRKPNHTGLYTNWNSFVLRRFKIN